MTEDDYILASNLQLIRVAESAFRELTVSSIVDKEMKRKIIAELASLRSELEKAIDERIVE